ncbi:MAG: SdrD B-like domain-containing protein [Synechococcales bacterium]|nr:SdrD B-like domain-containing protein [Synechococcales bacterium]
MFDIMNASLSVGAGLSLQSNPSGTSLSPYAFFHRELATFTGSSASSAMGNAPVSAEGIVSLNQTVSFVGDRLNLQDDASLYAGRGVNFNQAPDFSLKLASDGTPLRNTTGRLVTSDNVWAIGADYSTLNRPNNPYTDSLPVVAPRSVLVPEFSQVRSMVLSQKVSADSIFEPVNSGRSPINSVPDWQQLFSNGTSATTPSLIRVVGGGLNIPDGATLKNAVVIVESGDINFNGQSQGLENVVFIAEQGSVNLGSVQAKNLVVLANRSIYMNQTAQFSGQTLLANGSDSGIVFNGAMTGNGSSDFLTVISQGQLLFNATSDVRGELFSQGDFSFNSNVELLGAIQTKGNLTFNGAGSVRALEIELSPTPLPEPTPQPELPQVNRSPEIITLPTLQALIGDMYRYDVDATDADGDRLTYSLLNSPLDMTIDPTTGQINWNTATQTPGLYQTEIQVVDGRGGLTKQVFSIDLSAPVVTPPVVVPVKTGEIRGLVWDDLNRNGVIDSNLVRGQNPDIVFAIDVSGSSGSPFQGTPVGDTNGDRRSNTILDAEIAGMQALTRLLVTQGYGDRARVSLVTFTTSAVNIDMNPQLPGVQISTSLTADANDNGVPDVEDALRSLRSSGGTDFEAALQRVEATFAALNTAPGNGNLIFLTDGRDTGRLTDEVERLNRAGVNISAFGAGSGAALRNLQVIDPEAQIFQSSDELLALFGGIQGGASQSKLETGIANVRVYLDLNGNGRLDANEPTQLTNDRGEYRFTNLQAGSYQLRQVIPTNYLQTFPGISSGSYEITLVGDDVVLDRNFGNAIAA